MYCPTCGNNVNPNEKFCARCGTPVEVQPQPQPAPQPAPVEKKADEYEWEAEFREQIAAQSQTALKAKGSQMKMIFGLVLTIVFATLALFVFAQMICDFVYSQRVYATDAISYLLIILASLGIAASPFLKDYGKFCALVSGSILAIAYYGFSMIGLYSSFGYIFVLFGFVAFVFVCWLGYTGNNLLKFTWFVPSAILFLGFLINWIVIVIPRFLFSPAYYVFDILVSLLLIGGGLVLGLFLLAKKDDKAASLKIPNPASRSAQPQ